MPSLLRVLIVDDHSLFRKGLRAALENQAGIEIIAEAGDGAEAILMALEHQPDVILMDVNMPRCNGLEATRQITRFMPAVKILILTASCVESDRREAIQCGAFGYMYKDIDALTLVKAVKSAAAGKILETYHV